jgi:hypothetical protein
MININKSVDKKLSEPSARDDFFVYTMRSKDKNYMSHDPRFSEKAMNERLKRGFEKSRREFEERQNLAKQS